MVWFSESRPCRAFFPTTNRQRQFVDSALSSPNRLHASMHRDISIKRARLQGNHAGSADVMRDDHIFTDGFLSKRAR